MTVPGKKSRITIDECRFMRNGIGAQIKIDAAPTIGEKGGRCRVSICPAETHSPGGTALPTRRP